MKKNGRRKKFEQEEDEETEKRGRMEGKSEVRDSLS